MRFSEKHYNIANRLRQQIQHETEIIDDGESVAMILLWSFLLDHARAMDIDVEQLAKEQLESFIDYARSNVKMVKMH